ncbi:FliH/SctL family protein [Candidatus Nucleicultrix amoebiphila]|jgi:flagellar biosynthesis/type III secretory pathway protein FliH|uniref:Flagellar assembly protein FliH/Type III secretion system HrpE domain-containing protein n=1 Tax=Candidatus Nucleicultrix amoebiphila FS5 TaxID=1414854 RepID=A0A1W6N5U4_9PROT|nr:hypothetical protein [Candidatus Nucleicultrix amoebiphila]ARN85265.1 hypothetical protein GQ61_08150 [Candidatus Nucleicultrix amoebiphila FS5]
MNSSVNIPQKEANNPQKFIFGSEFHNDAVQRQRHLKEIEAEYQKGFDKGREAAKAAIENLTAKYIKQLNLTLDGLYAEKESLENIYAGQLAMIVKLTLQKICPPIEKAFGQEIIESFIKEALSGNHFSSKILLKTPTNLCENLKKILLSNPLLEKHHDSIVIEEDSTLGPADCTLEWANVGLKRQSEEIMKKIDIALNRLLTKEEKAMTQENKLVIENNENLGGEDHVGN